MTHALSQFRTEIRHFFLISILNLVFAAIALAFGVQYLVTAILAQGADPATAGFRILTGAVALVCFGLGTGWILATIRIFEGIEEIKDDLETEGTAITDNRLTCLIVRMLAHYRDNRKTISTMILVCTLGGGCFFVLGIANSIKGLSVSPAGFAFTPDNLLLIPAMLFTLGIAFASLLSSYYFSKFSKVWDGRLHEIETSECTLKEKLGMEGR